MIAIVTAGFAAPRWVGTTISVDLGNAGAGLVMASLAGHSGNVPVNADLSRVNENGPAMNLGEDSKLAAGD